MDPLPGLDGGLIVLGGVARPPGQQDRPRLGWTTGEDLRGVELEAPVDLVEDPAGVSQLSAHEVPHRVDAGEDVLKALPVGGDALRAPDENVPVLTGVLILQPHQAGALPHVPEGIEGASRAREAQLPLQLPGDQVPGTVQDGGAGLIGALDPDEHAVLPRPVRIPEDLRVTVVGRVALGVGGDKRISGPLGEVGQVTAGHQALTGGALVGHRVLEVAGVEQLERSPSRGGIDLMALQHDRVTGIRTTEVVGGVRDDGGGVVAPVQQVRRGGVPPVDQLAVGMEGAELVEGVVGVAVDEQPVGIVESAHRRDDVEAGIVRVIGRCGCGDCILGQAFEVLNHEGMLAGPLSCAEVVLSGSTGR